MSLLNRANGFTAFSKGVCMHACMHVYEKVPAGRQLGLGVAPKRSWLVKNCFE